MLVHIYTYTCPCRCLGVHVYMSAHMSSNISSSSTSPSHAVASSIMRCHSYTAVLAMVATPRDRELLAHCFLRTRLIPHAYLLRPFREADAPLALPTRPRVPALPLPQGEASAVRARGVRLRPRRGQPPPQVGQEAICASSSSQPWPRVPAALLHLWSESLMAMHKEAENPPEAAAQPSGGQASSAGR